MNKRHYEHTLPNIRGSLSNTYREMHIQALKCILYEYKLENNIYKKNNP